MLSDCTCIECMIPQLNWMQLVRTAISTNEVGAQSNRHKTLLQSHPWASLATLLNRVK